MKIEVGKSYRIPRAEGSFARITGTAKAIDGEYVLFDNVFGQMRAHQNNVEETQPK